MIQVGKIYCVGYRVMSITVYERVQYNYPDPNEDYYLATHDNRFIDWFDPLEREWGYRYSKTDLKSGDIILVLDINRRVQHAWSSGCRPDHVAIKFLKGDVIGWIYQPLNSAAFTEVMLENPYNIAEK